MANSVLLCKILDDVLVVYLGKLEYSEVLGCVLKSSQKYTRGCVEEISAIHPKNNQQLHPLG